MKNFLGLEKHLNNKAMITLKIDQENRREKSMETNGDKDHQTFEQVLELFVMEPKTDGLTLEMYLLEYPEYFWKQTGRSGH